MCEHGCYNKVNKSILRRLTVRKLFLTIAIMLMIASTVLLAACESTESRVQQALEKMEATEDVRMTGDLEAEVELGEESIDMTGDFDITMENEENVAMVFEVETEVQMLEMEMTIELYMMGNEMYMRMAMEPYLDIYIDASSMLEEVKDTVGMDLSIFDFDVDNTEIIAEESTIKYKGENIEVLEVKVLLDDDQLTDIIKSLFAQQNFASDTLTGQALEQTLDMYESIEVESAEYTLYIDKNNDIKRYSVSTVFTMQMMGETAKYDMNMDYDIIETGESVKLEMPDIPEDQLINFDDLLSIAE